MAKLLGIYKCEVCGNMVEVLFEGVGELHCCGQAMTEEHYIQWIEVLVGSKAYREFFKPGQEPQASFCIETGGEPVVLREYCNLHGLWKA